MKIYYSNAIGVKFAEKYLPFKIGVLDAFSNNKSKLRLPEYCSQLFLDSGAFSAWTQGKQIDLDLYIAFIKKFQDQIKVYASLDDITSGQKSKENYLYMIKAGLSPLPVFHLSEPESLMKDYLSHCDYIGLGAIAKQPTSVRVEWLDHIFSKYPDIKFHGFGIQDTKLLLRYNWFSVDASTAHVRARYGEILTPFGSIRINPKAQQSALLWKTPLTEEKMKTHIQNLGFDYKEAITGNVKGTAIRFAINTMFFEDLIKDKKSMRFKKRGFGI